MKRILTLLIFVSTFAFAQKVETLAGEGTHYGGFGGTTVRVTGILGQTAVLIGGEGAMLMNHTFGFGGGGGGLITNITINDNGDTRRIRFGYGGVKFYYISNYEKLLHFTAGLLIGGGGVNENHDRESYGVFVAEPSAGVELNLSRFFRIELSATYRFVHGITSSSYGDSDFSGLTGMLFIKFGAF